MLNSYCHPGRIFAVVDKIMMWDVGNKNIHPERVKYDRSGHRPELRIFIIIKALKGRNMLEELRFRIRDTRYRIWDT
jgi:hypothetical protein